MNEVVCNNCGKPFKVYPAWVRKGAGKNCSRQCSAESRTGGESYIRDEEHRKKMSAIVRNRDLVIQSERFTAYNKAKKGKRLEEIYGVRAEEIREKYTRYGEKNSNWKGGIARGKYPYIFYQLRPLVFERDGYVCLNCGMTQEEAKAKDSLGRGLTVHHIDYNKENNTLDNLATTCKWCNSLANSRREVWQKKYTQLLLGA